MVGSYARLSVLACIPKGFRLPLDAFEDYFGSSIGLYFAFLEYYTRWLVFPAAAGALVYLSPHVFAIAGAGYVSACGCA